MSREAEIFKPGDEVYLAMEPFIVKSMTEDGILNLISPSGHINVSVNPKGVTVIKKTYNTEEVSIKLKESYDRVIKCGGDMVDKRAISQYYTKIWTKCCKEGKSYSDTQSTLADAGRFEDAAIKYLTRLNEATIQGIKILKNTNTASR